MATNRFNGLERKEQIIHQALYEGLRPDKLAEFDIVADLSEGGAGSDTGFNEDYSSTATFASYRATAPSVIHRIILNIALSSYTGAAALDETLWLGGAAALTNGIKWGVSSSSTFATNKYASGVAKTIEQFSSVWGADVFRDFYSVDATAGDNHDHVRVTLDFVKMFGFPIQVNTNDYIGVYINDNLSSSVTTFIGMVTGRLIFPTNG